MRSFRTSPFFRSAPVTASTDELTISIVSFVVLLFAASNASFSLVYTVSSIFASPSLGARSPVRMVARSRDTLPFNPPSSALIVIFPLL